MTADDRRVLKALVDSAMRERLGLKSRSTCVWCGGILVQPKTKGRWRDYCKDACRRAAERRRRWERVLVAEQS